MTDKELLLMAIEARKFAYAPYSNHKVGAALLGKSSAVAAVAVTDDGFASEIMKAAVK